MHKYTIAAASMLILSAAGAAAAADLDSWTGAYGGLLVGGSQSTPYGYYHGYFYTPPTTGTGSSGATGGATSGATAYTPPTAGAAPAGYISYTINKQFADATAAGALGYNWQSGRWVFGADGDFGWVGGSGGGKTIDPGGSGRYDIVRIDDAGHLRGRLGYDIGGWLPYAAAGMNFDQVYAAHWGISPASPVDPQLFTSAGMQVGWTAGVGLDKAMGDGWVIRTEYMRDYLSRRTYQWVPGQLFSYSAVNIDVFRVGMAKRF